MKLPARRTVSEPTRWDPFEETRKIQERLSTRYRINSAYLLLYVLIFEIKLATQDNKEYLVA